MDLPALSADANASLRRARAGAVEHGGQRADLGDILIGILDAESTAVRVLEMFETEPDMVRTAMSFLSRGQRWPSDADAEEGTVDLARAEAARLGQDEAGSEHLLLALLRQSNSVPNGILESLGVTLDSAREAVRYIHGEVPDWQRPEAPSSVTAIAPLTAMEFEPGDLLQQEAARRLDASMGFVEVGMSPLDTVIGIGLVAEASDVLVELISLEIRETGAILHWRSRTADDGLLGDADVTITDDVGSVYDVFPAGSGGSGHASNGEIVVTPHPPAGARSLVIDVRSFGGNEWMGVPSGMRMQEVIGPWRFEVELGA